MTDLKLCPFCEGNAEIVEGFRGSNYINYIKCNHCEAIGEKFGNKFSEKDKAVKAWNTRPIEDAHKPGEEFTIRVAHILTSDKLSDLEKLDAIKVRYRMMAFPEKELSSLDKYIIGKVYE